MLVCSRTHPVNTGRPQHHQNHGRVLKVPAKVEKRSSAGMVKIRPLWVVQRGQDVIAVGPYDRNDDFIPDPNMKNSISIESLWNGPSVA